MINQRQKKTEQLRDNHKYEEWHYTTVYNCIIDFQRCQTSKEFIYDDWDICFTR